MFALGGCVADKALDAPSGTTRISPGAPCERTGDDPTVLQGCLTEARADLDGDGRDDVATVVAELGAEDKPVAWWLLVETTRDDGIDTNYRLRPHELAYRVVAAEDTAGSPRPEIFVEVEQPSGATRLLVFGVDDGGLFRYRGREERLRKARLTVP